MILVTGATGFLGGQIATHLLTTKVKSTYLVRAETISDARTRLKQNVTKYHKVTRRIKEEHVILGDLTDPSFIDSNPILEEVTHIINCAAIASFSDKQEVHDINVDATYQFIKAASKLPNLKRFVHVGTAFSCGMDHKDKLIYENWDINRPSSHIVPYTRTKVALERLVRDNMPNLPFLVVRPSIIVGHTIRGCNPCDSIFWWFLAAQQIGSTMELPQSLDIVPVNYASNAILYLTVKDDLVHDVYHISTGKHSNTLSQILHVIDKANGTSHLKNYKTRSIKEIKQAINDTDWSRNTKRLLKRAFPLYSQFGDRGYKFDNTRLLDEGFMEPWPFVKHINKCAETTRNKDLFKMIQTDVRL